MPKYVDIEKAKEYVNLSNEAFISLKGFYIIPKDTPAADVVPIRHGRWIKEGNGVIVCSECGEEHEWEDYRAIYCEDCGAKMDGN